MASTLENILERLFLIDKTKMKVYKQNIFCQKSALKSIFSNSGLCVFLIPLINSNKRINDYRNGLMSVVIDLSLSDHDLLFSTRKAVRPTFHKDNKILVQPMKCPTIDC